MKQLNVNEGWAFYLSGEWKKWKDIELLHFQMFQNCWCVGVREFKKACQKYQIQWDLKNSSLKQRAKRLQFCKKHGLSTNPKLEDYVPKYILSMFEKRDIVDIVYLLNKRNEKNKACK
ncbi:MAG: hypothetical protein ACLFNL_10570 [Bacteroidales bacterium]